MRATPPPSLSSPTKISSWTTAIASPFNATALALVHWCQRCASASVPARTSLRPLTIASERTGPVFCSAVHPVRCRFMPVSSASIKKNRACCWKGLKKNTRKFQEKKQTEICTIQTQILKFTKVMRMVVFFSIKCSTNLPWIHVKFTLSLLTLKDGGQCFTSTRLQKPTSWTCSEFWGDSQNGRLVVASTEHLVFSGTGSRGLSQRQTPTRTDELYRQAALGISPLSSLHNSLFLLYRWSPGE